MMDGRKISEKDANLLELYRNIFPKGFGEYCNKCRNEHSAKLSRPIGAWFVGSKFDISKVDGKNVRLLFVGKNAVGTDFNDVGYIFLCPCFQSAKWLWEHENTAYWTYTREIVQKLFGDDSMEYVAYTNMLKCNDAKDREIINENGKKKQNYSDTATASMKSYCINKMKIIKQEIEIIKPTHIVFYTATDYDKYIDGLFKKVSEKSNHEVWVGAKKMPWREAEAKIEKDGQIVQMLRIGHPQYKLKEDFVNAVVDWVKGKPCRLAQVK